jgi:multicomponent Na+:H+ antiporter subunit D
MSSIWNPALPFVICFTTALICIVWTLVLPRPVFAQRLTTIVGNFLLALTAAKLLALADQGDVLILEASAWPAPWGIVLMIDRLSAVMVLITGVIGLAGSIYLAAFPPSAAEQRGQAIFWNFLLLGVCGAFVTGDMFNLYVWFETLLIASFVLMVLSKERDALVGGFKYVILSLAASTMFLLGCGLLYNATGTLNMADLHRVIAGGSASPLLPVAAALICIGFMSKAAMFPLWFWLPESYHTPSPVISGVFAGLLTKVGVYALIRMFTQVFAGPAFAPLLDMILVTSLLTMALGVVGAAVQKEMRRILSFHIISQVGYMTLGLALGTGAALAGAIFYTVHHIIVKTTLFFVGGLVEARAGTGKLIKLGGMAASAKMIALLFAIPALSLAGIPPFSGFWAKFMIARASVDASAWISLATALAVSLATIFSMSKIWNEVFWKNAPSSEKETEKPQSFSIALASAGCLVLIALTLWISVAGAPLVNFAQRTANQLRDTASVEQLILSQRGRAP